MKFLLFTKPSCRIWIFSLTETHALYYTHTYIHAHGPSRTLLIIIGWDACGMCPGKHKYSAASVAETWLPRRLICSPNIFSALCNQGFVVYLFPCIAGGEETVSCACLFTSQFSRGCLCVTGGRCLCRHCANSAELQPGFCPCWPNHRTNTTLVC